MKLTSMRSVLTAGLLACVTVSSSLAGSIADHVFDYAENYKYFDEMAQKVVNDSYKAYFIFDEDLDYVGSVIFWVEGSKKYYRPEFGFGPVGIESQLLLDEPDAPYAINVLDEAGKQVMFSGSLWWGLNGFGTARWSGDQLAALNVAGATCEPFEFNGTFRLKFNKSVTRKAAENERSGLEQVIIELEKKGYEPQFEELF